MKIELLMTLLAIGFMGSFLSGLLGIGGAIINYPLLLFLPTWLGVGMFTAHEVSGLIAMQVFVATLSGVVVLRKQKLIHPQLVAYMGAAIMLGSFLGGYGGMFLSGSTVNLVYAILASLAAVMMLIPKKGLVEDRPVEEVSFSRIGALLAALIVGVSSGIVGAGGSFLLVPVMLTMLKIPTRMTIASSLAITFLSSIGTLVGKVTADHILWAPALVLVVASLVAAPLGTMVGRKVNPRLLQGILAVLIMGTTVKIWFDVFTKQ